MVSLCEFLCYCVVEVGFDVDDYSYVGLCWIGGVVDGGWVCFWVVCS